MTAICAAYTGTGLTIVSDGLAYDTATGIIGHTLSSKVRLWPAQSMVTGGIGSSALRALFEMAIEEKCINDFDELRERAPVMLFSAFNLQRVLRPGLLRRQYDGEIFIMGLSKERRRYEMYRLSTHEHGPEGYKPYACEFIDQMVFLSAVFKAELYPEFDVTAERFEGLDEAGLARFLARGICAARQMSGEVQTDEGYNDGGPSTYHWAAGGMIQLTKVNPVFMTSSIIYRWNDDKRDQVLDPSKGDPRPAGFWEGLS